MIHDIPTDLDWDWGTEECPFLSLDVQYAREKYSGKTLDEFIADVVQIPISVAENLLYMPAKPFRYYVKAFENVLLSDDYLLVLQNNLESANAANTFLCLLKNKLTWARQHVTPIMPELLAVAEFVAMHQERFQASPSVYGTFVDALAEIRQLYSSNAPSKAD